MGADLIVNIAFGPDKVTLTDEKRDEILKLAKEFVAAAKHAVCAPEDGECDRGSGYIYEENITEDDKKYIESVDVDDLEIASQLDPEKVLNEFLTLWNESGNRDSASRTVMVGDQRFQIITAGDTTWGDEPEGLDYLTIKNARVLGIPCRLGIQ